MAVRTSTLTSTSGHVPATENGTSSFAPAPKSRCVSGSSATIAAVAAGVRETVPCASMTPARDSEPAALASKSGVSNARRSKLTLPPATATVPEMSWYGVASSDSAAASAGFWRARASTSAALAAASPAVCWVSAASSSPVRLRSRSSPQQRPTVPLPDAFITTVSMPEPALAILPSKVSSPVRSVGAPGMSASATRCRRTSSKR